MNAPLDLLALRIDAALAALTGLHPIGRIAEADEEQYAGRDKHFIAV